MFRSKKSKDSTTPTSLSSSTEKTGTKSRRFTARQAKLISKLLRRHKRLDSSRNLNAYGSDDDEEEESSSSTSDSVRKLSLNPVKKAVSKRLRRQRLHKKQQRKQSSSREQAPVQEVTNPQTPPKPKQRYSSKGVATAATAVSRSPERLSSQASTAPLSLSTLTPSPDGSNNSGQVSPLYTFQHQEHPPLEILTPTRGSSFTPLTPISGQKGGRRRRRRRRHGDDCSTNKSIEYHNVIESVIGNNLHLVDPEAAIYNNDLGNNNNDASTVAPLYQRPVVYAGGFVWVACGATIATNLVMPLAWCGSLLIMGMVCWIIVQDGILQRRAGKKDPHDDVSPCTFFPNSPTLCFFFFFLLCSCSLCFLFDVYTTELQSSMWQLEAMKEAWSTANSHLRSRLVADKALDRRMHRVERQLRDQIMTKSTSSSSLTPQDVVTMQQLRDDCLEAIRQKLRQQVLLTISKSIVLTNKRGSDRLYVVNSIGMDLMLARLGKLRGVQIDQEAIRKLWETHGTTNAALMHLYRACLHDDDDDDEEENATKPRLFRYHPDQLRTSLSTAKSTTTSSTSSTKDVLKVFGFVRKVKFHHAEDVD